MSPVFGFFGERRNWLGECPTWDARTASLYWVDSLANTICRADADGGNLREWATPSHVGSFALAPSGLIAALADGFYALDLDTGAFSPLALPEQGNAAVRFNDGKADRQGRFLAGTMRTVPGDHRPAKLYRLEPDATTTVLESDFGLANSTCFSPDGRTLYFADSLQDRIWAYDYDGTATNRRVFLDTLALGSPPDGATVDAEGCLWVALVRTQRLVRVDPAGAVVAQIDMPVEFPSCPAFGGPGLGTMFVTSLSKTGMFKTDHPDGGRIVTVDGLGVAGLPEAICSVDLP